MTEITPTREARTEHEFGLASQLDDEGGATLHADWLQGRGVYGGMVSALLTHGIEQLESERALRTLDVTFRAPATPGPCRVEVELERAGRSVSYVRASLHASDDGRVLATARATCAKERLSALNVDALPPPDMPSPSDASDGPSALYFPEFCRHFEFRQALGPRAFSRGDAAHIAGWCRPRAPHDCEPALIIALLDAWAPAASGVLGGWAGAATIDATTTLLEPLAGIASDAWYAFEARSRWAHGGYAEEVATLHGPDGRALATARQWIAVFGAE